MAFEDTWQDLVDAIAGEEGSGSIASAEPINNIAHEAIRLEKTKATRDYVDKNLKNKVDIAPPPLKAFDFSTLSDEAIDKVSGNPIAGAGESGTALEFDGNSYVQISPVLVNENTYTIEFKIKTKQAGSGMYWFDGVGILDGDREGWRNDFGFGLVGGTIAGGGYLAYGEGKDGGTADDTRFVKSLSPINDGIWHKVTLTRSNGFATLYIDDKLNDKQPCFETPRNDSKYYYTIGSLQASTSPERFFVGMIDDLKFYTTVEVPYSGLSMVGKTGKYQDLSNWAELKGYIDGNSGGGSAKYDYIINSQADFDAMIASDTWLGATRILFNADIRIEFENGNMITVPQDVRRIDGNSHTITINSSGGGYSLFRFATKPTDFSMGNLNVNWVGSTTGGQTLFEKLTNIHDCIINVDCKPYRVFSYCDNLDNIRIIYGTTGIAGSTTYPYYSCNNLSNCYGYVSEHSSGSVYSGCTNSINCEAVINDNGSSGSTNFSAYETCKNLTNCKGVSDVYASQGNGKVYSYCTGLSNCTVTASIKVAGGTNVALIGFNNCSYTSNCRKVAPFTGTLLWSGATTKRNDDSCDLE